MNRKAFLACVLMCVILTGCETAKKISEVIKNPDIQVGSLKEQPSEITVTLLTEPDTNTNAEGESAAVDVQLVYLTDDSKLLAADYDQIASTPLPDVLGKNYIDHQDFNLLPDTIKTLPPVTTSLFAKILLRNWKLRRKSVTSSSANRTVWEHPLPWKRYRFQAINAAVY